jgi:hypothetical protein
MADNQPPRGRAGKGLNEKSTRDKLFQLLWTSLRGWLRVLAVDDLDFTDWTMHDIGRFHVTFGSACPGLSSAGETGEREPVLGGDR